MAPAVDVTCAISGGDKVIAVFWGNAARVQEGSYPLCRKAFGQVLVFEGGALRQGFLDSDLSRPASRAAGKGLKVAVKVWQAEKGFICRATVRGQAVYAVLLLTSPLSILVSVKDFH